ncbi:cytochrome P450 (plasmid) [Streptomyces viridifaciens]|nr:cytochrome P450 [Streptomyces viridifaciens]
MTTADAPATVPRPLGAGSDPVPLYTAEFASDPAGHYRWMRERFGSLAPVLLAPGVPATLVIGYRTAREILHDQIRFPADPRAWQSSVPHGSPILPMVEWRPNALRNSGAVHQRYRAANLAALDAVDLHRLNRAAADVARRLSTALASHGHADLIRDFALPVAFDVLNGLLGCPPETGAQVAHGMALMFDSGDGAERGGSMVAVALFGLVAAKRARAGDDITSRLLAHPAALTDEEMVHQLVTLYGAGIEPQTHLIGNALRLMLTDERFSREVHGGSLSVRDAIDEALRLDPPLANYCLSYPPVPTMVAGVLLPANQPVVIGIAACNADPEMDGGPLTGTRAHLAFSAGPHACPARTPARVIAERAISELLYTQPEMALAVPADHLVWRTGPFHRALSALPVHVPVSVPAPAA